MTDEHFTFDMAPAEVFADTATRVIRGLAVPTDGTAVKGGRTWRFTKGSVKFGDRTPLLAYHDPTRPVGRLTKSAWTDRGLEVEFAVSKTTAGDEVLQLASDGVLGLSAGVDVAVGGAKQTGDEFRVTRAFASEISVTPTPAFAGSSIDHVSLSTEGRTATMPDTEETAHPTVVVNLDAVALADALRTAGVTPDGPTAQPVPKATATTLFVAEPPPYRFDGVGGAHGFVADAKASQQGDGEARQRLETFLSEVFVTQANVSTLNPVTQRPDLYQGPLRRDRPLAGLISTATIANNTPFILPKFNTAGNLVNPHVEGVEPTLATFTATSQTISPGALSGKAELTREVWDQGGNPQVDALVWQEMLAASDEAAEARVAAMLDALTLTPIAITGVDDAAVNGITSQLVALQYARGGNRYSSLALNQPLYTALVNAQDTTGRKLLPVVSPSNSDGTTDATFGAVRVGNATGVPAWGLSASSYLMVPGSVWQWLSPPQKLVFDVHVKSIYIGLYQYAAEAVIRDGDVKRITYAAS